MTEKPVKLTWQNLSEGRFLGLLRHGRAWLRLGRGARYPRPTIAWEWRFGAWQNSRLMVTTHAEEQDLSLSIGLGFANLHVSVEGMIPFAFEKRSVFGRSTGFYLWGEHFVIKWNCDDSSWSSVTGDAHGWSRSWFLLDVLLGRAKYTKGEPRVYRSAVIQPEGAYECTVEVSEDTWKRPRWPWTKRVSRGTVEVPGGVPVPGKGENAWDCGEDAIYSRTAPAWTGAEAVAQFRAEVSRLREKRGGRDWRPAGVRP